MRPPNQIISNIILQYKGMRTRLWLTFANVFMFLFLGSGARGDPRQFRDVFTCKL